MPFDGFITARPVAAGEYVALTNKIATIVAIAPSYSICRRPNSGFTGAYQTWWLGDAYPGRDFEGKVSAINQSVDPNSRIFILEARFANPGTELKPGMFARAACAEAWRGRRVLCLARGARDTTTDSNQAFVIQNGKARLRGGAGDPTGDTADRFWHSRG